MGQIRPPKQGALSVKENPRFTPIQKMIEKVFPEHNVKIKPQRERKISESSSDSNHTVVLDSDDVSGDSDDDIMNENDFVLVKFCTKVEVIYYIARVISAKSTELFYPLVDDISIVERDDIVLKLPEPNSAKTARTASLLLFYINLSGFDVNQNN
ncbi:hypothetical protein JTB14_020910 [Gonioctena quinquepunctata]|nr:hypothetical protein JTB14_020910 [Gonioctena quinquepunctata]